MTVNRQGGATILVLADDEEIRDGIRALLESDGYRICAARSEQDAVEAAIREKPDLILVTLGQSADQVMASASRVRIRARLNESVPIVMFSISTIAEGAELETAKNIYATRPDNFDQLRKLLNRLLSAPCAKH